MTNANVFVMQNGGVLYPQNIKRLHTPIYVYAIVCAYIF